MPAPTISTNFVVNRDTNSPGIPENPRKFLKGRKPCPKALRKPWLPRPVPDRNLDYRAKLRLSVTKSAQNARRAPQGAEKYLITHSQRTAGPRVGGADKALRGDHDGIGRGKRPGRHHLVAARPQCVGEFRR